MLQVLSFSFEYIELNPCRLESIAVEELDEHTCIENTDDSASESRDTF